MVLFMVALSISAQHEEGEITLQPKVGMNIATLSDANKPIVNLHFGLETEYMMSDQLNLAIGAIVSNQGAKYDEDAELLTGYNVDLDYFQVPVTLGYYVLPGLSVKAGLQLGFRMKAKVKLDEGGKFDMDELAKYSKLVNPDEDYSVNKFDLSIPVGISYEFSNFVLDARYNWGLLKIQKNTDAFYNRCFMLSLGYKFQIGDQ